ncbi:MAG: DUF998 domain-containing protein [Candidatus Dormibacteria bacterium]
MTEQRDHRVVLAGALCWILTVQYFIVQPVVAAAWPTPYSYLNNYISDLGNTACGPLAHAPIMARHVCSPLHGLMNASFVALGLLTAAGAGLARWGLPRGWLTTTSMVLLGLSGIGVIVVGFAPENVAPSLHLVAAIAQVPPKFIAMALLATATWRSQRRIALWTSGCGALALAGSALYLSRLDPGLGVGGVERLALDPFTIWTVGLGYALLRGKLHDRGVV